MTDQFSFMLRASGIDGVGVFATHAIKKGAHLSLFSPKEKLIVVGSTKHHRNAFYEKYCIRIAKSRYSAPADFRRMSIGWYLNHSSAPNVGHIEYEYFALRYIRTGEELTINYGELDEFIGA